jgi:ankyrin repeat protein
VGIVEPSIAVIASMVLGPCPLTAALVLQLKIKSRTSYILVTAASMSVCMAKNCICSSLKNAVNVNAFLAASANVNYKANDLMTPLHNAALCGNKEVVEILLAAGANPDARDKCQFKPLSYAIDKCHLDTALRLFDIILDIEERASYHDDLVTKVIAKDRSDQMGKLNFEIQI